MPTPASADPDAFLKACPSRALLARIAEKWAPLVLVALEEGPMRFGARRRRVEGVSQKMLTQTLRALERDGLVTRRLHDEMPLRMEYVLTTRGRSLMPLAAQLKQWAEKNLAREKHGLVSALPHFSMVGSVGPGRRRRRGARSPPTSSRPTPAPAGVARTPGRGSGWPAGRAVR